MGCRERISATLSILAVLIFVVNCQDVTAPTFTSTMCNGQICVGLVDVPIEWWVYEAGSFEEDTNVLEDDDYLSVAPGIFNVFDGTTQTASYNLQNATATSALDSFFSTEWNGARALSLNYTLQVDVYTIVMGIFLLEQDATSTTCAYEIDFYNRDFIIALNVTSTKQSSSETFSVEFEISHQNGCLSTIAEDSYQMFNFNTCGSTDSDETLGFGFGTPLYGWSTAGCPSADASTLNDTLAIVQIENIALQTDSVGTGYNVFVRSGKKTKIGWAILLAIVGGLVIIGLLAVGLIGYLVQKRNRSRENVGSENIAYEDDEAPSYGAV